MSTQFQKTSYRLKDQRTQFSRFQPTLIVSDSHIPPRIFLGNVSDVLLMGKEILGVIGPENFMVKVGRNNTVCYGNASNPDDYHNLVRLSKDKNATHFTYQLKEVKAYRVIVKQDLSYFQN